MLLTGVEDKPKREAVANRIVESLEMFGIGGRWRFFKTIRAIYIFVNYFACRD